MGPLEFTISTLGPFFRMIIFTVFTVLGLTSASVLMSVTDEKFYTDGGLKRIDMDGFELVHIANIISSLFQMASCFYCGMKVIHVPHEPYQKQIPLDDKYIWHSHEAIFLIIAAGINSNLLTEKLFENDLFQTVYKDNDNENFIMTNANFHDMVKYFFIVCRFVLVVVGVLFIFYNLVIRGKNRLWSDRPKGIELFIYVFPSLLFMLHTYYGVVHFVELNPSSLEKQFKGDTPDLVKNRHLEFVLENISDLILSVLGLALVWIYDIGQRNHLASTILFNTFIMGLFGTCLAIKNAFSIHVLHGDVNSFWVPILFYVMAVTTIIVVNGIKFNSIKLSVREYIQSFYTAIGGNRAPEILLWRLGITLGIVSLVLAIISTQAQWFVFQIHAGSIPNATLHVLNDTVSDIEELGTTAFDAIKKLDPCQWGNKHNNPNINDNVSYNYNSYPSNNNIPNSDFSLSDYDIKNMKCTSSGSASCAYINEIKAHVDKRRGDQDSLYENSEIKKLHTQYQTFLDMESDGGYLDSMRQCHTIECDVVLGVAIAAEVSLFAGDSLSWIPGVGGAIDTAAWFAEIGNRVGHNIIKYAMKGARFLTNLAKKIEYLKPLIDLLKNVSELAFKKSFQMHLDMLLVYVPLVLNGFICILIGFWRRENVHKAFQMYSIVVTFYVPLMILNLTMVGLMYLFPIIVQDICAEIPRAIMIVIPEEHVGFSLLRTSYLLSTMGSIILVLSSLLDDAYFMRKKTFAIRQFFKHPFEKKERQISTEVDMNAYIDNGFLQALIISSPVVVLFFMAYHYDWKFVSYHYGPSGPLLKIVNSFHGHTNIAQETNNMNEWVNENSLCGIVGKAIESSIHLVINEVSTFTENVITKLDKFVDGIIHFSDIISKFENSGKKLVNVIDATWVIMEKTLVLIVPLLSTILLFVTTLVLPRTSTEYKEEGASIVKQILLIGIYYNVVMIVMMQQLFSTVSNMELHVLYFEFKPGPLMAIGLVASGLNMMSLVSLYVEKVYKVEQ